MRGAAGLQRPLLAAVIAAAALAAGCGGGDDESATTEWAGSVCSAITTWTGALSTATDSLRSSPSVDGLKTTVGDLREATQTFADDLKGLDRPETEAGQQAQDSLDGLADEVDSEVQTMQNAVDDVSGPSDVVGAVSTVTSSLSTMGSQVASTFQEIGQLDAAGELEDAFREADSCDQLTSSGS